MRNYALTEHQRQRLIKSMAAAIGIRAVVTKQQRPDGLDLSEISPRTGTRFAAQVEELVENNPQS